MEKIYEDPNGAIRSHRMNRAQIMAVAVAVAIIGIEGYDILSVSLASPGFAEEWGLNTETLGLVLAMETFGAAAGSLLFGRLADLVGRRSVIVWGLGLMTIIMALSATATNVVALACWSLLTGLCIGGTTPSLVTLVSEVASDRRRDLAVTLLGFGYSLGLIVGGAAVAFILLHLRWPWVFALGCVLTGIAFLLALFFVPETIPFLERRRPANALARINTLREKFGHGPIEYLPAREENRAAPKYGDLFLPHQRVNTLLITGAYVFQASAFYFTLKWLPKIIVDMGHSAAEAASAVVIMNMGGFVGATFAGFLVQQFGLKRMMLAVTTLSTIALAALSQALGDLEHLAIVAALAGMMTNAGLASISAAVARAYPNVMRATGAGLTIGVGRGLAAMAPFTAGAMFAAGMAVPIVMIIMSLGSIAGGLLIARTRFVD